MYTLRNLSDDENYKNFLLDVLDYIDDPEIFPDKYEEYRIFVGGTTDSNQTLAEDLYLTGRLGALAQSDRVGYALIHFLQMIINRDYDLIYTYLESFLDVDDKDSEFTMEDAIEIISSDPEDVYSHYPLTVKSTLMNDIVLNPSKADLWDIERIREYITDNF